MYNIGFMDENWWCEKKNLDSLNYKRLYHDNMNKIIDEKIDEKLFSEKLFKEKLGQGGFGSVHKIGDKAVKKINPYLKKTGQFLIELGLLSCVKHPNLMSSDQIFWKDKHIYIFQELALCDLSDYTKNEKHILTIEELKSFSLQTLKGLNYLHNSHIIHADIKASNLFLMQDKKTIKLGDFSISAIQYLPDMKKIPLFTYKAGTPTYKAPEILMGLPWDYSIDLWSFGCTMFEIAYGRCLFPSQSVRKQKNKITKVKGKEKEGSIEKRKKYLQKKLLNCQWDWMTHTCQINPYPSKFQKNQSIKYKNIELPVNFSNNYYSTYNDLILRCLQINPKERATIESLKTHPLYNTNTFQFFSSVVDLGAPFSSLTYMHDTNTVDRPIILNSLAEMPKVPIIPEVQYYATNLYYRYMISKVQTNIANLNNTDIWRGCLAIGQRLLTHDSTLTDKTFFSKDIDINYLLFEISSKVGFLIL